MWSFQGVDVGQFPFQHFWLREELSSPQEELPPLEPAEVVEELPKVGRTHWDTGVSRRCCKKHIVGGGGDLVGWVEGCFFLFGWMMLIDKI